MLKRQRPATPPPSSLSDPPSYFADRPIRPLLHTADSSHPAEPRTKRRRLQPPPLNGALRGWTESEPTSSRWESDGEEDWVEDAHDTQYGHPPDIPSSLASATINQYKDTNSLLHELHTLNQHRLLFSQPGRDARLNLGPTEVTSPVTYTHHLPCQLGQKPSNAGSHSPDGTISLSGLPYHPLSFPQGSITGSTEHKADVREIQSVRQRYEDTNRLLGSLFLTRRRELEGVDSSTACNSNS